MKHDPTSLKLFVRVVEEGTIAAAAEKEFIAAAAVSRRISELESTLNTQLLLRTNKGVEPTAAGVALLNLARRALHELEAVYVQMQDYASGVRGHIRVFANISAITQFLPRELKDFLAEHPQVEIHLEEKISTAVTRAVADNAADIGIYTPGSHPPGVEVFGYHPDTLAVIVAEDHPLSARPRLTLDEMLDYDFVGLHAGSAINTLIQGVASERERAVQLRMQVTGYDVLCLMVEAGHGIGVLPEAVARLHAPALKLRIIPLDETWARRELKICVRRYDALPVAARLLVDHLRRRAGGAAPDLVQPAG
ncbi:LysR family transcriptional regulator [Pseudomonas benzenivorans]|uniref:LysR family transcriptional regulator n=1 Tax=Pseudomonas benzenivorans TaxID=556533 RepID=A0ABY5HAH1_9PSED|nr:LysR family transcriptional regulator [Pseudomonas benzenivorans]UTW09346.1 LysR family transcriptional regulator [Pseudomonas benzenivorans]